MHNLHEYLSILIEHAQELCIYSIYAQNFNIIVHILITQQLIKFIVQIKMFTPNNFFSQKTLIC